MNIRQEIINIKDSIIHWRRDFHQYPELAFNEYRTGDVIAKELRSMGLEPKEKVGKTGVTADLKCGDGPVIAIRADMDALPIEETSGLDFSSKNKGVMHACGHDGHMAMLLGAAKIKEELIVLLGSIKCSGFSTCNTSLLSNFIFLPVL